MWNLKYDTNALIYKTEIDSQRTDLRLPRGMEGKGRTGSLGLIDANYYVENG